MRTYLTTLHVGVHGYVHDCTVAYGRGLVRSHRDAKRISSAPALRPDGQSPRETAKNNASFAARANAIAPEAIQPQAATWRQSLRLSMCPIRRAGCA